MFGGPVHRIGRSRMGAPAGSAGPRGGRGRLALAVALGLAAVGARAEDAAPEPAAERPPAVVPGGPSLDRLLRLPEGADYGGDERRGGRTRAQWASRFGGLRRALEEERRGLEAAQRERERIAGSVDQWLLGPPGATRENAPLDFRLRQEVARHRDEIERLEKDLKELEVEANLANVPPEWRE
jgi:hypothetical protein